MENKEIFNTKKIDFDIERHAEHQFAGRNPQQGEGGGAKILKFVDLIYKCSYVMLFQAKRWMKQQFVWIIVLIIKSVLNISVLHESTVE